MRISPVTYSTYTNRQTKPAPKSPAFTSLFADANAQNERAYAFYTMINPDFSKMKSSSTRIFRELPSQIAISKLLNPDEKSEIKVLGCSDGSEAWAYGITIKEQMGEKGKENVKIKGVDIAPYMITMAKTGRIICSDVEKKYANKGTKTLDSSPLKGAGWDKYLTKSSRPFSFDMALNRYPMLQYAETDPVAGKTIGHGLEWYEVNKDGLCEVSFEQGDMLKHLKPDEEAQNVVYVIANSGGYIAAEDPDKYISIFENIKKENEGTKRKVYVVTGDVENRITDPKVARQLGFDPRTPERTQKAVSALGFTKVPEAKIRKLGVQNYKDAASKIYVLND